MSPLSPSQALLAFGLAALALVVLFLLRRRAVRVVVPSLAPWKRSARRRVNPLWRQLLALLLQLAASAAIAAALVGDEPEAEELERDRVLVVDGSASMAAEGRMEAVGPWLRAGDAGLILAREDLQVLAPPQASDAQQAHALERLEAGFGGADLERAVALAQALELEPLVLSDRPLRLPEGVEQVVVGAATQDVSVDSVVASAGPGLPPEYAIRIQVSNHGSDERLVRLRLETVDSVLGESQLSLPSGETVAQVYRMQPVDAEWVLATLVEHQDALAANDRAFGLLPPLRPARVWLVGEGNRYLEEVLGVFPGLELRKLDPERYRRPPEDLDLVIFDRVAPSGRAPGVPAVYIDPPRGTGPFPSWATAREPQFTTWDFGHRIFRGVAMRHLVVEQVSVLQLPRDTGRVLAATDDGPAIVVSDLSPRSLVLGFDLTRSDLPLTVAFPQLVYNLVLWARADSLGEATSGGLDASLGLPIDPELGAFIERQDAPGSWEVAPGTSQLMGLQPGVYLRRDALGERLLVLDHPSGEDGTTSVGMPAPTRSEDTPEEPGRPRQALLALLGAALLLVEFVVVPR